MINYVVKLLSGAEHTFKAASVEKSMGIGFLLLVDEEKKPVAEFALSAVAGWWREDAQEQYKLPNQGY